MSLKGLFNEKFASKIFKGLLSTCGKSIQKALPQACPAIA